MLAESLNKTVLEHFQGAPGVDVREVAMACATVLGSYSGYLPEPQRSTILYAVIKVLYKELGKENVDTRA